jgi:hypothetical protein
MATRNMTSVFKRAREEARFFEKFDIVTDFRATPGNSCAPVCLRVVPREDVRASQPQRLQASWGQVCSVCVVGFVLAWLLVAGVGAFSGKFSCFGHGFY